MTRKIKIVFILGELRMGGTERQFLEFIRRLNRDQFTPYILAFHREGMLRTEIEKLQFPFTTLDFCETKGRFHPASYIKLYKTLRKMITYLQQEKPHIVQSYLPQANILATLTAKIAGVPIIITGRRATIDERYMIYPKFPDQWLQNRLNRWVSMIIANSSIVRQQCLQREKYMTEEKIQVVYNGVNINLYPKDIDQEHYKKTLQIPKHAAVVGIIANLHPRKGHQIFLNAAALVLQIYPGTRFLIIGRDDGMKASLEALTHTLHIEHAVRFTGERDDIPELLSVIDIQVSSSHIEGLSNALLEGMAAGKPIVATHVSGNPELIVDGHTGILVPPDNPERLAQAILRLLADQDLRSNMGKAGRQRAEQVFNIDQMVNTTERLYKNLVMTIS
ncbi:putative glycosyl transferase, group 1 [Candidatus Vecturithrix granuli]|uniref:Putative glycosyl transferase, group 1 n=1 Tax=Vecturithrix granuli TaxID=1499967 RepID=A0A081BY54_VECG1|nr:putative glycosyl transferase, group 1 [Candidatus Vecturithrix granuli]